MKFSRLAFFALLVIFSMQAQARSPVPIINHDNISIVTSGGTTLDASQVKLAIETAVVAKDWTIASSVDGKLTAKIVVRNKHTVMIEIGYDATHYSIKYLDSINMKYEVQNGQAVIHPFYKKWVDLLRVRINSELSRL